MLSFNNPSLGLGTCLDNREKWGRVWIIEKNGVAYNNSQVVRGCVWPVFSFYYPLLSM